MQSTATRTAPVSPASQSITALRSTAAVVIGSDIDEVRLAMAHHNVPDVALCRADALHPVSRDTVEQEFAQNRQLFLTEQGYRYTIEEGTLP